MTKLKKILLYGDSMSPTLRSGSVMEMKFIKDARSETKIGDIVCYKSKGFDRDGKHTLLYLFGQLVCHRIIGKTEAFALIKGDNREYIEKVEYDKILGVVKLP